MLTSFLRSLLERGLDITQGLPRVEELFEARPVRKPSIIARVTGRIEIIKDESTERIKQHTVRVHFTETEIQTFDLKKEDLAVKALNVKKGDRVEKGAVLFKKGRRQGKARFNGQVDLTKNLLKVTSDEEQYEDYTIPPGTILSVKDNDLVTKGDQITEGSVDLHELYHLKDEKAVRRYILKEIQYIYTSQGQKLNDKHIEIIIRQMFSRYYIREGGDTELLSGDTIERAQFVEANEMAKKAKKEPAKADLLLLGITKASLSTESFLSAASFQETARVLIDAAVSGKVDKLRGLKENVIIGKLIPAGTGFTKGEEVKK